MENIVDLLDPDSKPLQIREDPKEGIYVEGLTQAMAASPRGVLQAIQQAVTRRMTTSTRQNHTSSRSHAILQFNIIQQCSMAGHATTGTRRKNHKSNSENVVPEVRSCCLCQVHWNV